MTPSKQTKTHSTSNVKSVTKNTENEKGQTKTAQKPPSSLPSSSSLSISSPSSSTTGVNEVTHKSVAPVKGDSFECDKNENKNKDETTKVTSEGNVKKFVTKSCSTRSPISTAKSSHIPITVTPCARSSALQKLSYSLKSTTSNKSIANAQLEQTKDDSESSSLGTTSITPVKIPSNGLIHEKTMRASSPPPDLWKKQTKLADQILITDVISNNTTITVRECKTYHGFFKGQPHLMQKKQVSSFTNAQNPAKQSPSSGKTTNVNSKNISNNAKADDFGQLTGHNRPNSGQGTKIPPANISKVTNGSNVRNNSVSNGSKVSSQASFHLVTA